LLSMSSTAFRIGVQRCTGMEYCNKTQVIWMAWRCIPPQRISDFSVSRNAESHQAKTLRIPLLPTKPARIGIIHSTPLVFRANKSLVPNRYQIPSSSTGRTLSIAPFLLVCCLRMRLRRIVPGAIYTISGSSLAKPIAFD
jgi:hypothetical protein